MTVASDVSALSVVDASQQEVPLKPMQAFYFSTGITGTGCTAAPQDGLNSRDKLGRREGFGEIVVGPFRDAVHPVGGGPARGEHQDWHIRVFPHDPQEGKSVQFRQHQIQDDELGRLLPNDLQRCPAIHRGHHREPLSFEVRPHEANDLRVVVDHENGCAHRLELSHCL